MIGLIFVAALDLNTATPEQLEALPGIGAKKVEAIVKFRARQPFRRATEIMRIRGIGPKLYARLRDQVCAGKECSAVPVRREGDGEQKSAQPGDQAKALPRGDDGVDPG